MDKKIFIDRISSRGSKVLKFVTISTSHDVINQHRDQVFLLDQSTHIEDVTKKKKKKLGKKLKRFLNTFDI